MLLESKLNQLGRVAELEYYILHAVVTTLQKRKLIVKVISVLLHACEVHNKTINYSLSYIVTPNILSITPLCHNSHPDGIMKMFMHNIFGVTIVTHLNFYSIQVRDQWFLFVLGIKIFIIPPGSDGQCIWSHCCGIREWWTMYLVVRKERRTH